MAVSLEALGIDRADVAQVWVWVCDCVFCRLSGVCVFCVCFVGNCECVLCEVLLLLSLPVPLFFSLSLSLSLSLSVLCVVCVCALVCVR
jgi:hypothetical protein